MGQDKIKKDFEYKQIDPKINQQGQPEFFSHSRSWPKVS